MAYRYRFMLLFGATLLAALPAAAQASKLAPGDAAAPKGGYVVQERAALSPYAQDVLDRVNALRAAGCSSHCPPLAGTWQTGFAGRSASVR